MRTLMWFRADLRITDNPALADACAAATRGVVAVFTICPRQWGVHDWGPVKVDFLLRNLSALSERLETRNIPLLIRTTPTFDDLPEQLLQLARIHACDALYFNIEHEINERRRDDQVAATFENAGLAVRRYIDQTILEPDLIRTNAGDFYTVFTPFKRAWLDKVRNVGRPRPLDPPPKQPECVCTPDNIPERVEGFDGQKHPDLWPEGEDNAKRRLTAFAKRDIEHYHEQRDHPAADATSRLSPYLSLGVLSPRQCLHAATDANHGKLSNGKTGPDTWISELIWREFYRHVLIGFPRVSMNHAFRQQTDQIRWRRDENDFNAWRHGRTGFPIVDAAMRQLAHTGWMHNRLRMITAMFLTKDLLIDWRWGERHFMHCLVDGDLASNNGGWQWSASTGTDAAPYFRIFNPTTQSERFDPQGDFIRAYVPELRNLNAKQIHAPESLGPQRLAELDYPPPICNHKKARERAINAFKQLKS